jgi:hypothetical protein
MNTYNQYIIDFNSINKGMQLMFRFPNNYGLSIVCHSFSYGNDDAKFEIAVLKFNSDNNKDWNLTYTTDITNDVLGYQSKEDVFSIIDRVILL